MGCCNVGRDIDMANNPKLPIFNQPILQNNSQIVDVVWYNFFRDIANKANALQPQSLQDADASNNTIYYSLTQLKLVYKDSGGVVNNLY